MGRGARHGGAARRKAALRPALAAVLLLASSFHVHAAGKSGVSSQAISLPSGPGSIEGLGESFEPQLNTGTATYGVELALPPGPADHAPGLSVSYNGGEGNGLLGIGWDLMGLHYVQRQSDKGLPRYDARDTFVTSYGEELVPLSDGSFRAENERDFRRYRFDPASNTWSCDLPDGTTMELGAVADARVEDGSRTYRWYLTRSEDANGNRIDYEYQSLPGSPGAVYPTRIRYARHASEVTSGEQVVVFGYEAQTRPDPISDFRSGFQVVTGRRLARIDVCTAGGSFTPLSTCDDVGESGAARVRAYRFGYEEVGACQAGSCATGLVGASCSADADCVAGASRLASVTQLSADGVSSLPVLGFAYTELDLFAAPSWTPVLGYPDAAAGGGESAFADLDGDALPDVVETPTAQPGLYRSFRNAGPDASGIVRFEAPVDLPGPAQRLSTSGTQLADLDGDGFVDLVTRPSAVASEFTLYRGTGRGYFSPTSSPFQIAGFDDFSPEGFESDSVRLVDLDFDKRIDVMRTLVGGSGEPTTIWTRRNHQDGLLPREVCAPLAGVSFANGKSFLVDMNGDRLLDAVSVQTAADRVDSIRYYPATGRGGFGVGGSCAQPGLPVLLGGDPVAEQPGADFSSFRGFFWRDLTNDGLADLLFLGPTQMSVWVNAGGERLRRFPLGSYPPGITLDLCEPDTGCDPQTSDVVEFADLNGNGTTDLVLVDRASDTTHYLDVVGAAGVVPHLLRSIDNGLGARTQIDYEPATRAYLDAAAAGRPWRTRLPIPVTVVAARRVGIGLDLDGDPGDDEYVSEFRYRDGYYDAFEKEFRGFSEALVVERGDASQPTAVTRHSFHTGAPDGVDNDGDGQVDERTANGGAEEESLKGVSLEVRSESCPDGPDGSCADLGDVFRHDFSRWEVRNLYGATGSVCELAPEYGCCSALDCGALGVGGACVAGGTAEDGRFQGVEACVAGKRVQYAVQTGSRAAVIERGVAPRVDLFEETDYDDYGNTREVRSWGVVEETELPPFGCVLAFGICSDDPASVCGSDADCGPTASCDKLSSADGGVACAGDPFAFTNPALPDDERFSTMTHAIDEMDWLLRCEQESTIADESGAVESRERRFYDDLPLGGCSRGNATREEEWLEEESRFVTRVVSAYDAFGNLTEAWDGRGNHRSFEYDSAFRAYPVAETVHLDGYALRMTASHHEGFGMVTAATTWATDGLGPRYEYLPDGFGRLRAVVEPGDSASFPTEEYAYQLNPGAAGVSAVVTRRRETPGGGTIDTYAYVDGLSRELGRKEEGDDGNWVFVGARGYNRRGSERTAWLPHYSNELGWQLPDSALPRTATTHDELGRLLRSTHPDGDYSESQYRPLAVDLFDENDSAGITPGAYTSIEHDGLERIASVLERAGGQLLTTRFHYDARDNLTEIVDARSNRTAAVYDSLSRLVRLDDPDLGTQLFAFDDADNLVETIDAKGQRTVMEYDADNRVVSENYLDTTGDPASDPVDVVYVYDLPMPGGAPRGDGSSEVATHTAGELSYVRDLSGEEHKSYDARRRPSWDVKTIRDPETDLFLAYQTRFAYDSQDRITEIEYPDGDRVSFGYGARGQLSSIGGANGGPELISSVAYRASGQPEEILFGNGVRTVYGYDVRQRPATIRTTRGALELMDHVYELDPSSNPTRIDDLRAGLPSGSPRFNRQEFGYDDLQRLTSFRLLDPGGAALGSISYAYDGVGNMLQKSSDISHEEEGVSVTDLGVMHYGGALGSSGRGARLPGDAGGPHALTRIDGAGAPRLLSYDDNGNLEAFDGLALGWDFKDRMTRFESAELRASYHYDYADRRVAKRVERKQPRGPERAGDVRTVHYVSRGFEVRDGQPIKYVFLGKQRIAELRGTLDPTAERLQRIRLEAGWNLVALAVGAPDAAAQLGIGGAPIEEAWGWDAASGAWTPLSVASPLPQGSVLWLRASDASRVAVRGAYSPAPPAPAEAAGFVTSGLESLSADAALPQSATAWRFDAALARWRGRAPADVPVVSDLPPLLVPGQALFVRADSPLRITRPPQAASIRYYHADHLGSSAVVSDGDGQLVQEVAYYPFGHPRLRFTGTDHGRPPSDYLFTQKERDRESGLYDLDARSYQASLARFTAVDSVQRRPAPRSEPQRLNPYSYALNNPVRFVDPTGTTAADIANWWDRQAQETRAAIDNFVQENPSTVSVIGATALATAVDLGAGMVDVLRVGEGAAEGTASGVVKDVFRAASIAGAVGKGLSTLARGARGALASAKAVSDSFKAGDRARKLAAHHQKKLFDLTRGRGLPKKLPNGKVIYKDWGPRAWRLYNRLQRAGRTNAKRIEKMARKANEKIAAMNREADVANFMMKRGVRIRKGLDDLGDVFNEIKQEFRLVEIGDKIVQLPIP